MAKFNSRPTRTANECSKSAAGERGGTATEGVLPQHRLRTAAQGAGTLAAIYAALVATHGPLLRLPYYWDEAGYFIPAALDLAQHGWWIPHSTAANGHPPLLMAWLATAWHVAGFSPLVTRAAMLAAAALLLWGTFQLAKNFTGDFAAGWIAAGLLAVTPLFFAQASLAQLDLPAATGIVWALVFRARGRPWLYALLMAAACLTKETAAIVPAALLARDAMGSLARQRRATSLARVAGPHVAALAALGTWLGIYRHATGYWMGNPQFLAFNVAATLSLPRALMALWLRGWQLFGYEGVWAVTALALWGAYRSRGGRHAPSAMPALRGDLWLLIAVYLGFHAAIGGAVLARYLLPAVALYFVLVSPYLVRLPRPGWALALAGGLLVAHWFWNPPYPFPYEDNLAYATFVRLQQQGAHQLEQMSDRCRAVITAWPASNELSDPDLGYVRRPLAVLPVENFTAAGMAPRPLGPGECALLFSREYQPTTDLLRLVPFWRHWSQRYFHSQAPLAESALLARLHARAVFRRTAHGQWVAIGVAAGAANEEQMKPELRQRQRRGGA